jgi:two-component system, NarL family, sensor kinase
VSALLDMGAARARRRAAVGPSRLGETRTIGVLVLVLAAEVVLLGSMLDPFDWRPLWLVVLLAGFIVLGELKSVRIGDVYVSSTTCAALLAMALLGPVPAAAIIGGASLLERFVSAKPAWALLTNAVVSSLSALAGGLLIERAAGPDAGGRYAAVVALAGVLAIAVNVVLLGAFRKLQVGASFSADFAKTIVPLTPYHMLGILLATAAAQIVTAGGFPTLVAVLPVLLVSEALLRYVGVERARAAEVMALTNERANLLEQALTAEVGERRRIADHVHDEALQTLAVARQDLEDLASGDQAALASARDHLDAAVAELRSTLIHVHPGSVAGNGLGPALEVYAAQVFRRSGISWAVDVDSGLPDEHEALLYSLARELLINAAKHARASHVELSVRCERAHVCLCVSDDGTGIAPGATDVAGHFGLLTARHRVAAAGGRLDVSTGPRMGTTIGVVLPLSR